jgi:hypothetical protein
LAQEWEKLYPSAVCSGIVGDLAHRAGGGYHISRQDNPPGNYSTVRPDDRRGPANAAAAIDMSMNATDMALCTKRLRALYDNPADPRIVYLNAFNGWLGFGAAHRWSFVARMVTYATTDHTWHVHLELRRRWAASMVAMTRVRTALAGTTADDTGDDDMSYSKWTQAERDQLAEDLWSRKSPSTGTTYGAMLRTALRIVEEMKAAQTRATKEDAARDAALLELVRKGQNGELAAELAVKRIGELLAAGRAPAGQTGG